MNNLLTIGKSALTSAQAWVSVTGDNIANADTDGYVRRYVVQNEAPSVRIQGGEVGLGSNAEQILRYFDKFLEDSYIDEDTKSSRWSAYDDIMETLESVFNEANATGLADTMNNFFNAWQKLSLNPDDASVRTNVLNYGQTLGDMFVSIRNSVAEVQDEMDFSIANTVSKINELTQSIRDLNVQISSNEIDGVLSPNGLYDRRDSLVEELATLVNIKTFDNGSGNFKVQMGTGQPLVDGTNAYELSYENIRSETYLLPTSNYNGEAIIGGSDEFEYTVEITKGGNATATEDDPNAVKFKVSLDGGLTWLENEYTITNSNFATTGVTDPVLVKDLMISFSSDTDFEAGDRFEIVPKKGLYWNEPTRGAENVTPQIYVNGTDNINRVTGGKITAYFAVRDDCCGRYLDELDALARSVMWEVNRIHSQGAGLTALFSLHGQNTVIADQHLGEAQSGSIWYDRLSQGNVNFYFYDANTGSYLGTSQLFSGGNFDPSTMSLIDVRDAVNAMSVGSSQPISAVVEDGKLLLTAQSGFSFAVGEDTTGLMAVLGLNTFFRGEDAATLSLGTDVAGDYKRVNAGHVDYKLSSDGTASYEFNEGDNTSANAIGELLTKRVDINTGWKNVEQSLPAFYAGLISTVGSDKVHAESNKDYHSTLSQALQERKESLSGVNLDEEMTNLVKYQSAYKAAAKLISTADEMMGVLL
ncbi:MAG: flagellar hook-associated protein FlgK, partial [Oxalobacter sp.]|nr:flagellar hook-associated protein FlgK [Oxalobacter sp.]